MKWNVEWTPSAEQVLADLWLKAADPHHITTAANRIDAALERDPLVAGESRTGTSRILIEPPLAVQYDVIIDDRKVLVWDIWRWQSP
jgi:hypothetical protein